MSTFKEYEEARERQRRLFKPFCITTLLGMASAIGSLILIWKVNPSGLFLWVCAAGILIGMSLFLLAQVISNKYNAEDLSCRRFLNQSQDQQKVTYWTNGKKLKDIEEVVRQKTA